MSAWRDTAVRLPSRAEGGSPMSEGNRSGPILLVEDKVDDERLTLRALSSCGLNHEVYVVRDGGEALDYLFGLGRFKGRDVRQQPVLVLLDLALPTVDG